ncbi:MAG: peptidoglycan-binding protein [Ilumatobacteraceae bacterium]
MRRWPFIGGAIVLAGAAGITAVVVSGASGDDVVDADQPVVERSLVEVTTRDLVRSQEFDGTAGHGTPQPLVLAASGTLTSLPTAGDVLSAGDTVVTVDGAPVVVLSGPTPMWRTLGPGVDDGADIVQLEFALAALGYAEEHDLTVDEEWTSATTRAVKAFQEDHGQDDDGTVDLGEIVWVDGTVRVDSVGGTIGQAAAEAAIEVTAPEPSVDVDADVASADLLPVGGTVDVELPSGEVVSGTVTSVGVTRTDESGASSVPIEITLDSADGATPDLADGLPVDVVAKIVSAEGVVAVPVEAVLALAEGGYAVEVELADGTTRLVGVELGVFADGYVEVTGEVAAGDQVVVP